MSRRRAESPLPACGSGLRHASLLVVLAAGFLAACGSSSTTSEPTLSATNGQTTATTGDSGTGGADAELVVEQRPITARELDRIDDDGEGGVVECDDVGGANWDYGPVDDSTERGRVPSDALRDALDDLNRPRRPEQAEFLMPATGWLQLDHDDGRRVTFVHEPGRWQYLIEVGGDPDTGVWRHHSATLCQPEL
ncbi:MAG: hypothetical protein AAFY28_07750 [Actinomycetota bacterium]